MSGSPSEEGYTQAEPKSFWQELGVSEREFLDETLAPEVDRELLLKLVRQELPESAARVLYRLIYSFASWYNAHTEILLSELRERRGKP